MFEPRIQPQPKPLGSLIPNASLSNLLAVSNPVRVATESKTLDSKTNEVAPVVAWGNVAREYATVDRSFEFAGIDFSDRYKWIDAFQPPPTTVPPPVIGDAASYTKPAEEPFLHVIINSYRKHPITGVIEGPFPLHYSDIDRPVGKGDQAIQLDGRVIDLSYIGKRFSADFGIARLQTTIRLRNNDAALNELFRDPMFLRAVIDIKVGFRTLPPNWYRPVGPRWRVDRVTSITADYVELSLIDATDNLLGSMIQPPTKSDVRYEVNPNMRGKFPGDDPFAPVPFGAEWVQVFKVNDYTYAPTKGQKKQVYQFCLGVTRTPDAIGPKVTGHDIVFNGAEHGWKIGIMRKDDSRKNIEVWLGPGCNKFPRYYLDATIEMKSFVRQGRTWYAAILTIEFYITAARDAAAAIEYGSTLHYHALSEELYVQWPFGAEGRNIGHDPASIIELLVTKYMQDGSSALIHKPSFDQARKNYGWTGISSLGGTYKYPEDGASVIGAIAKTHRIDLAWGTDRKLHVSSPFMGKGDLASAVPGCPVYDAQWDVVRNSWNETIPLGSERWGLANSFRINGIKNLTREGWVESWNLDRSEVQQDEWARILEADVDWSWLDGSHVIENGSVTHSPLYLAASKLEQHTIASLYVPLFGLELDCGDFVRISHFAGSQADGGYSKRLFRVEEVGLEWSSKRVKLVLVDMDAAEKRLSAQFDNEENWSRIRREMDDGVHEAYRLAADKLVVLIGPLFSKAGIKAGDFIINHAEDYNARIIEVIEQNPLAVLVRTDTPSAEKTMTTFDIQRSHLDPPSDTDFPGKYPLGSNHYFRSCDEATGRFSDNTLGYRAENG